MKQSLKSKQNNTKSKLRNRKRESVKMQSRTTKSDAKGRRNYSPPVSPTLEIVFLSDRR